MAREKKAKTAGIVTIQAPGRMSDEGRAAIAKWLRGVARNLKRYGSRYTEKRFTSRYLYF